MDPSNGCLSLLPLLWKRKYPQRAADGLRHKNLDVCLIFGIPSWPMPLRDRSGQSSQPFWHGVRGRSGRSNLGSVGTRRHLRCTHSAYVFNQACLGSLHRFPSRPFGSPFHPFPFTHSFSSFFSCLPLLHVLSSHSFLSLARATVRALVCTRAFTSKLRF